MFSRKVIAAMQIMCVLGNFDRKKVLAAEIKKQCTLDDRDFRKSIYQLSKTNYIHRTITSPVYLTMKRSLSDISIFDVIQDCHGDFEIGEILSVSSDPIYNYRYLNYWSELNKTEEQLKNLFIEHLKNIKLIQLKPTSICHNTEHYF